VEPLHDSRHFPHQYMIPAKENNNWNMPLLWPLLLLLMLAAVYTTVISGGSKRGHVGPDDVEQGTPPNLTAAEASKAGGTATYVVITSPFGATTPYPVMATTVGNDAADKERDAPLATPFGLITPEAATLVAHNDASDPTSHRPGPLTRLAATTGSAAAAAVGVMRDAEQTLLKPSQLNSLSAQAAQTLFYRHGAERPLVAKRQILESFLQRPELSELFPNDSFPLSPADSQLAALMIQTLKESLQHGVNSAGGGQKTGIKRARESALMMLIGESRPH
jgi:hypothetical protein